MQSQVVIVPDKLIGEQLWGTGEFRQIVDSKKTDAAHLFALAWAIPHFESVDEDF